ERQCTRLHRDPPHPSQLGISICRVSHGDSGGSAWARSSLDCMARTARRVRGTHLTRKILVSIANRSLVGLPDSSLATCRPGILPSHRGHSGTPFLFSIVPSLPPFLCNPHNECTQCGCGRVGAGNGVIGAVGGGAVGGGGTGGTMGGPAGLGGA